MRWGGANAGALPTSHQHSPMQACPLATHPTRLLLTSPLLVPQGRRPSSYPQTGSRVTAARISVVWPCSLLLGTS